MRRPRGSVTRVTEIQHFGSSGPWNSSSGGKLELLFQLRFGAVFNRFFNYDEDELAQLPTDIRGFRLYRVCDIPRTTPSQPEWHRIRHELVFVLTGSVWWRCEDAYGDKKTFTLERGYSVWVPPFVLHHYEAFRHGTELLVLANTLFDAENAQTHDTYLRDEYRKLQAEYTVKA